MQDDVRNDGGVALLPRHPLRRATDPRIWVPKRAFTLGARIAQARREKGLLEGRDVDQIEVAEACGVSGAAVSRWESNQKMPRDENVLRLAQYLGVTPSWLRYGVEPKRIPAGR